MINKTEPSVTINNCNDVKQDVDTLFDDFINMDNDLKMCGDLPDSDILASVTNTDVRHLYDE